MYFFVLGFNIRVVVAGPTEARWWIGHRDHGRRISDVVGHVRHGGDERAVRADGRQSARHQDLSGGRLSGVRRVRHRAPVSQGVGFGARIFPDGLLAGMLDGVPDGGAHDSRVQNGVRAVRPGGMRTRGQRPAGGGGQEFGQRTAGETSDLDNIGLLFIKNR